MAKSNDGKTPELLDDPNSFVDKIGQTEDFFRKNRKLVTYVAGSILFAVAGFVAFKFYVSGREAEAQTEMFNAVYYFEADSLDKALNGDGKTMGFTEIADEYGMTKSANLAKFYIGVIAMKKGKWDEAIENLEAFGSSDLLVQARAYSLIGDAYMEKKEFDKAAGSFHKASDYKPNEYFTPRYLMKEALAFEKLEDYESAVKAYDIIIKKYSNSMEVNDAKKFKAFAETKLASK